MAQALSIGNAAAVHAPVISGPLGLKRSKMKRVPTTVPTAFTPPIKASPARLSSQNERSLPSTPALPKRQTMASGSSKDLGSMPLQPVTFVKGVGKVKMGGETESSSSSTMSSPTRVTVSDPVTYVLSPLFIINLDVQLFSCSITLAQRLNELAVANADGLLKYVLKMVICSL